MEERKAGVKEEKMDIMTTMINVNIARRADCSMLAALGDGSSLVNFESMLVVYTLDISAMDDAVVVVVVVVARQKKRRSQRTTVRVYLTSAGACTEKKKKKEEKTRTIPNAMLILRIHTIPVFFPSVLSCR